MGVSKEMIGKILIGNRFYVKLRILSTEILFKYNFAERFPAYPHCKEYLLGKLTR